MSQRIINFGEVFTPEKEVNSMLGLVSDELHRIDSKFLEPACGDGVFLKNILIKKIDLLKSKYGKDEDSYKRNLFLVVTSLYGIEILEDNIENCREILFNLINDSYKSEFKKELEKDFFKSIKYVLNKNLVWGDALNLIELPSKNPIVFSDWSFTNENFVKRTEYKYTDLIDYRPFDEPSLFSDLGNEVIIPKPINQYPVSHYLKIYEQ